MNHFLYFLLIALLSQVTFANTIKGIVTDQITGEEIPFANVILEKNGVMKGGTTTDVDGSYEFKGMDSGKYDVKCLYLGYRDTLITNIEVKADKTTTLNITMSSNGIEYQVTVLPVWRVPLIDRTKNYDEVYDPENKIVEHRRPKREKRKRRH